MVLVIVVAGVGLGIGLFAANFTKGNGGPLPSTTDLQPEPAAPFWAPILYKGQPPSDVISNLEVPVGAVSTGYDNLDAGVGQYDRKAAFFAPVAPADVLGFYALELPALGWRIRATGTLRNSPGRQILAYRFSRDSYEWQLKVVAAPATRGPARGTAFSLEAFQVSEDAG